MDIYIIKDFEFSSFYNSVRWILDIGNKINLKIKVILSMEPKFTEKYEDIKNLSYKKVKKTQFLKSIIYIYFQSKKVRDFQDLLEKVSSYLELLKEAGKVKLLFSDDCHISKRNIIIDPILEIKIIEKVFAVFSSLFKN